jgi:hypothetical protein
MEGENHGGASVSSFPRKRIGIPREIVDPNPTPENRHPRFPSRRRPQLSRFLFPFRIDRAPHLHAERATGALPPPERAARTRARRRPPQLPPSCSHLSARQTAAAPSVLGMGHSRRSSTPSTRRAAAWSRPLYLPPSLPQAAPTACRAATPSVRCRLEHAAAAPSDFRATRISLRAAWISLPERCTDLLPHAIFCWDLRS